MKLEDLVGTIESLPPAERSEMIELLGRYESSLKREKAQKDFMSYVKHVWPGFIEGRHHQIMAQKFEDVANGKIKRLIVCLGPRHTKSEFASYLLPSWFLGNFPSKKVIQCSNTAELAVGSARKVRILISGDG